MTLEDAFVASDNTVFARLTELLDLKGMYEVYSRFGLTSPETATPAIVLGALDGGIDLLSIASSYAAIARGGVPIRPRILRGGEFVDGRRFECPIGVAGARILEPSVLDTIQSFLRRSGRTFYGQRFSGKTGTTRTGHIFAGYNEKVAAAIWVGYTRRQSEHLPKAVGALNVMSGWVHRLLGQRTSIIGIC
jgi:membrane peptidoglycan carboxypeptidase